VRNSCAVLSVSRGNAWCWRAVRILVFALVLTTLVIGCSRSANSLASSGNKAFQNAPPAVKADWDIAAAALGKNDYCTAILTLRKLQEAPNLTPEQTEIVKKTATAASDQMYDGANKGDANAKKSIEDLRKAMGR